MRLVLASASPRRAALLEAAGIAFDVEADDLDETHRSGESPQAYVERLARAKAERAGVRHPDRPVLGADTTVVLDGGVILGKPSDATDAALMLRRLAGRAHTVLTGAAIAYRGRTASRVDGTIVHLAALSEADIAWYVHSGEPMGKAGAYAIQGLASRFVTRIDGAYGTVVGLSVASVLQLWREIGAGEPLDEAVPGQTAGNRPQTAEFRVV